MEILGALFDGILIALQPINLDCRRWGDRWIVCWRDARSRVGEWCILLPFTFVIQSFTGATSPMIFLLQFIMGRCMVERYRRLLWVYRGPNGGRYNVRWKTACFKWKSHVALVIAALGSFVGATVSNIFYRFCTVLAGVALSLEILKSSR